MPTATAPAQLKQVPLEGLSAGGYSHQVLRSKIAVGVLPLIGIGGAIAGTAALSPGLFAGLAIVCGEIALAATSIYILWPKQSPTRR